MHCLSLGWCLKLWTASGTMPGVLEVLGGEREGGGYGSVRACKGEGRQREKWGGGENERKGRRKGGTCDFRKPNLSMGFFYELSFKQPQCN